MRKLLRLLTGYHTDGSMRWRRVMRLSRRTIENQSCISIALNGEVKTQVMIWKNGRWIGWFDTKHLPKKRNAKVLAQINNAIRLSQKRHYQKHNVAIVR